VSEPAWFGGDPIEEIFGGREREVAVLRRIDLWSALKVSLALYLCLFVAFLGVLVAVWMIARQSGAVDSFENFMATAGFDGFRVKDGEVLKISAVVGPIFVVLASLVTVAGVALYNLVARLVGGVEVTIAEGDGPGKRPPLDL
jgi:ethanolamine transporter EutH